MDLKLTLVRDDADPVDLVVDVDADGTVGTVADALALTNAHGDATDRLSVEVLSGTDRVTFPRDAHVLEVPLRSGSYVRLVPAPDADAVPSPPVGMLTVLDGPEAGSELPLRLGSWRVGRAASCDIVLSDPLVSATHARLHVSDSVEIVDLSSSNGIEVAGSIVASASLQDEDVFALGNTRLRLSLQRGIDAAFAGKPFIGFPRSPRLDPVYEGSEHLQPTPPDRPDRARLPIVPILVPVLMGVVMFLFTRSAMSVVFVAMMPLLMLGTYVENGAGRRRDFARARAQFRADVADLEQRLLQSLAEEQVARRAEHPSAQECVVAADRLGSLLWTRRPEHDAFLTVRLGLGAQPSRNTVKESHGDRGEIGLRLDLAHAVSRYRTVPDVPVVGDLRQSGGLGVAVGTGGSSEVAFGIVIQLLTLHAPTELAVAALASSTSARSWDWLKWLPHVTTAAQTIGAAPLASAAPTCVSVTSALLDLIEQRRERAVAIDGGRQPGHLLPAIVVIVEDDAPVDRATAVAIAETGPAVGVHVLWVAPDVQRVPAACRVFVDATGSDASAGFVHDGSQVLPLTVDAVDLATATAFAHCLAPVVDASARSDEEAALPGQVSFVAAVDEALVGRPETVLARWAESGSLPGSAGGGQRRRESSLRAWVGVSATESMYLDLRTQGPHALIGGTTGSGKSEFLQTWIMGMATAHSPARVNFLFVDYKGGSAFADCVRLPHAVGLVTDLSPHLVIRALTSLNAELRHRERVLHAKRAKDLAELERRGDPDAPPSLVIVVDEFAALVQEVPAFVDGVVNVAQRGRSLGLHLVLATQRPAGVIKDNLRANTNLRIALRMADEADSVDVLGDPVAATFSPELPGRAMAKTGPGRLTAFQSGYVGGWTTGETPPARACVRSLAFGAEEQWLSPDDGMGTGSSEDPGPNDLQRMVDAVQAAAGLARIDAPRKPWLPELAPTYALERLVPERTGGELVFGVADLPESQQQPVVAFAPDRDGSLAVFGASGSGKSVFLRTIACAAGLDADDRTEVYAIDAGSRGMSMIENLPHVGSVIVGEDRERVERLVDHLREVIDTRAHRYARVAAGTIVEYRAIAEQPDEARIIVLVDNYGALRQEYETAAPRMLDRLTAIAADGRPVGVHVVLSADRPGAVPTALASAVQRRLVLRMASENDEAMLGVPKDMLSTDSPAGRGVWDGTEIQVAVLGGDPSVARQTQETERLADTMRAAGRPPAAPVRRLDEHIPLDTLPETVDGLPVLGVEATTLSAIGIVPEGVFVVTGPPQCGRTSTLMTMTFALRRAYGDVTFALIGRRRSPLLGLIDWSLTAVDAPQVSHLATTLVQSLAAIEDGDDAGLRIVLVVESVADWVGTPAEGALGDLLTAIRAAGQFAVVEGEISTIASGFGVMQTVKSDRYGLALQPDQADGDLVFKTSFPRSHRRDYVAGRGLLVRSGKTALIQVARRE